MRSFWTPEFYIFQANGTFHVILDLELAFRPVETAYSAFGKSLSFHSFRSTEQDFQQPTKHGRLLSTC